MEEDLLNQTPDPGSPRGESFAHKVLIAVVATVVILALLALLWFSIDILLLAFAGVLIAILLRGLSDPLARLTRLSPGLSLALVIVALVGIATLAVRLLAPGVGDQADRMFQRIPKAIDTLEAWAVGHPWAGRMLERVPRGEELIPRPQTVMTRAGGIFATTFGAVANLAIVLFIGIYAAIQPKLYVDGIIRLVPLYKRPRAREILGQLGRTLRWWLVARFVSMVVIGVLTAVGLVILGIPLALALGLFAALLTFVPYLGAILSVIPAALIALVERPMLAVYVLILYAGIQLVETYLITPLIERRVVHLAPALVITGQVLFALIAGPIGVLLATPLTAVALVLVRMIYIEDTLGDV